MSISAVPVTTYETSSAIRDITDSGRRASQESVMSPLCVVKRLSFSVGAIPTRQRSLRPVAIGAAVEVTKPPKPSMERVA